MQPERTELAHGRGGQRGARSSGRHRGITLETRNARVRSILKALIQLPELRRGAAAGRKGVLLLIGEVSCGKSWGKRDFFFPFPRGRRAAPLQLGTPAESTCSEPGADCGCSPRRWQRSGKNLPADQKALQARSRHSRQLPFR